MVFRAYAAEEKQGKESKLAGTGAVCVCCIHNILGVLS